MKKKPFEVFFSKKYFHFISIILGNIWTKNHVKGCVK